MALALTLTIGERRFAFAEGADGEAALDVQATLRRAEVSPDFAPEGADPGLPWLRFELGVGALRGRNVRALVTADYLMLGASLGLSQGEARLFIAEGFDQEEAEIDDASRAALDDADRESRRLRRFYEADGAEADLAAVEASRFRVANGPPRSSVNSSVGRLDIALAGRGAAAMGGARGALSFEVRGVTDLLVVGQALAGAPVGAWRP